MSGITLTDEQKAQLKWIRDLATYHRNNGENEAGKVIEELVGTESKNDEELGGILATTYAFASENPFPGEIPVDSLSMTFKTIDVGENLTKVTPYFGEGVVGGIGFAIFLWVTSSVFLAQGS